MRRLSLQSSSPLLPHSHHYENGKDKHSSITTFRITAILCLFILAVLVVNAHITITNLREQLSEAQEGETLKETAEKKWSGLLDQEKELRQAEIQKRVELEGELETFRKQYESCNIREKQKEATKYPLPSPNYPIDFERMYPDMFGPRPTPLIPGQKILFMMAVGKNAKSNLDTIINMLGLESVTYMLFHYDDVSFADYSWNHDVIHVTMYHQMKWWYIKRFVHPDVAKFYEYVYIMDEDCILPAHWNNTRFLEIARRNQLDIFQPSHNNSEHKIINTRKGSHAGRFTDFVEVGPFTIFSVAGYNCVWNMLLPDVVGGWGYDLFFANYCKLTMGIVDATPIYHGDTKTASKERHDGAEREQNAVLSRYEGITHTWFGKMKTKGYFY